MTVRISEVYQSMQGEGPRVGIPTTFVRFGGCNLRCPGWPCDTQHAIDPKYRLEWWKHDPAEVVDKVQALAPRSVCFTGGEPMLQPTADIVTIAKELRQLGYHVEMFSNGTLEYSPEVLDLVDVVMDWKLPGSGEAGVGTDIRRENLRRMKQDWTHSIKFTIADRADFNHAVTIFNSDIAHLMPRLEVFAGIVWDKEMTNEELCDLILHYELPWRLNVQVHNHIWDRTKRGI